MEDKKYEDNVFDCLFYIGLNNSFEKEMNSLPSDEELKKMYPVPKKIPRSIKAKIKKKKYGKPAAVVYLTRIIIGIMIAVSLTFTILATDEGVRTAISHAVLSWFDGYVKVGFDEADAGGSFKGKTISDLSIGYVPNGFVISQSNEDDRSRDYLYSKGNKVINIVLMPSSTTDVFLDTDTDKFNSISINGNEAYITEKDGNPSKTIVFGNSEITCLIYGTIEKEELIKIAENIK